MSNFYKLDRFSTEIVNVYFNIHVQLNRFIVLIFNFDGKEKWLRKQKKLGGESGTNSSKCQVTLSPKKGWCLSGLFIISINQLLNRQTL